MYKVVYILYMYCFIDLMPSSIQITINVLRELSRYSFIIFTITIISDAPQECAIVCFYILEIFYIPVILL